MKNLSRLLTAIPPLLFAGAAAAQGGPMMNNGMWGGAWMGGYGGYLVPVLLVVAVALVAWVVMQKRK